MQEGQEYQDFFGEDKIFFLNDKLLRYKIKAPGYIIKKVLRRRQEILTFSGLKPRGFCRGGDLPGRRQRRRSSVVCSMGYGILVQNKQIAGFSNSYFCCIKGKE